MPRVNDEKNNKSKPEAMELLTKAQRDLAEMEAISAKTLDELQRQRKLINNSRTNLKTTQEDLQKSDSLLTRMMRCCRG